MINKIERKIFFYQIIWVNKSGEKAMKDLDFLENILKMNLNLLDYDDIHSFILEEDEIPTLKRLDNSFWKISKIRKSDLPLIYKLTTMESMPLDLMQDEGLYDPTHFVIFDGKIIGTEFNYYGPRVNSTLRNIINDSIRENPIDDIEEVEIIPILRRDIYDLIEKFEKIKRISIRVATNYAKLLKQEDPSFEKMFSAADLVDDMYLRLTFSLGRGSKQSDVSAFEKILRLVKKAMSREDWEENIKFLEIRGRTEEEDSVGNFNLIHELMMVQKKIAKLDDKTRAINPTEMYEEIVKSHSSLKNELKDYLYPVDG